MTSPIPITWPQQPDGLPPVHSQVAASVDGLHVVLVTLAPGADVPVHRHPHTDEVFDFLDPCAAWTDGAWRDFRAGETLVVPAGALHGLRNPSGAPARLRETVRERVYARHALAAAVQKRLARVRAIVGLRRPQLT